MHMVRLLVIQNHPSLIQEKMDFGKNLKTTEQINM
jgi:hypothetical protein